MSSLAHFYHPDFDNNPTVSLNEDTARHIAQVLRMQMGEKIVLVDGKGLEIMAAISEIGKKKCTVTILERKTYPVRQNKIELAIAFTKNTARNEWLLEKVAELGVATIVPLITQRGENHRIKTERWNQILIAAMLQSQQYFLPQLTEGMTFEKFIVAEKNHQKLIAHCLENESKKQLADLIETTGNTTICIGPEGDFSEKEIELAFSHNYIPVNLGNTRLRTETAAIAACSFIHLIKNNS